MELYFLKFLKAAVSSNSPRMSNGYGSPFTNVKGFISRKEKSRSAGNIVHQFWARTQKYGWTSDGKRKNIQHITKTYWTTKIPCNSQKSYQAWKVREKPKHLHANLLIFIDIMPQNPCYITSFRWGEWRVFVLRKMKSFFFFLCAFWKRGKGYQSPCLKMSIPWKTAKTPLMNSSIFPRTWASRMYY